MTSYPSDLTLNFLYCNLVRTFEWACLFCTFTHKACWTAICLKHIYLVSTHILTSSARLSWRKSWNVLSTSCPLSGPRTVLHSTSHCIRHQHLQQTGAESVHCSNPGCHNSRDHGHYQVRALNEYLMPAKERRFPSKAVQIFHAFAANSSKLHCLIALENIQTGSCVKQTSSLMQVNHARECHCCNGGCLYVWKCYCSCSLVLSSLQ